MEAEASFACSDLLFSMKWVSYGGTSHLSILTKGLRDTATYVPTSWTL